MEDDETQSPSTIGPCLAYKLLPDGSMQVYDLGGAGLISIMDGPGTEIALPEQGLGKIIASFDHERIAYCGQSVPNMYYPAIKKDAPAEIKMLYVLAHNYAADLMFGGSAAYYFEINENNLVFKGGMGGLTLGR